MSDKRDIWPEFVYRYVEHYRWEPQHLGSTVDDFYAKIRRQEVPLNFLFNMLLYALPASYRRQLLGLAGVLNEAGPPLVVRNSRDRSFVQADMELDSELERVFVELKVTAKTGLDQVQKYLMLHALMAAEDGVSRQPSLIFVTKNTFPQHWRGKEPLNTPDALAPLLRGEALLKKLRRRSGCAMCWADIVSTRPEPG